MNSQTELRDDLRGPFDAWDDEGAWEDLRDEPRSRHYSEVNRRMAEKYPEAYQQLHLPSATPTEHDD